MVLARRKNSSFRWRRQLHVVRDASGERLCGMVDGAAIAGVLPVAQFTNGQSFSVLRLPQLARVQPFVVHTVWIRQQREVNKLMRLREARLWVDEPSWYAPTPPLALSPLPPCFHHACHHCPLLPFCHGPGSWTSGGHRHRRVYCHLHACRSALHAPTIAVPVCLGLTFVHPLSICLPSIGMRSPIALLPHARVNLAS